MLLTILALVVGYGIGRARGGSWSSVLAARLKGQGFLVAGVAATLVLNVLTPSFPLFWLIIAFVGFIGFTIANLTMTGAIVLLFGLLLNVAAVLANGAVPVSEVALQSVDAVDDAGAAAIDGPRESTATATRLSFLGDVIPVPVVDKVVSIGDLIALVAVADILVNLMLRSRRRELDDAGVTFAATADDERPDTDADTDIDARTETDADDDLVIDLREDGSGPAHAAPGGIRLTPPLPRVRRPAHAPADSARHLGADAGRPIPPPSPSTPALFASEPPPPAGEPEPELDLTDRRPIIDLTVSPTDDQLAEFLRRRAEADRRMAEAATEATGPTAPRHSRRSLRRRLQRSNAKSAV